MSSLPIREDGSEIVSYDFDDYPIRIRWLEQPLLQPRGRNIHQRPAGSSHHVPQPWNGERE